MALPLSRVLQADGTLQRTLQREELLETLPNGTKILAVHGELQKLADNLDQNVGSLLEAHERDFLAAYKTHMQNVQREYLLLRSKADEQETRQRREGKIASLSKELKWFMAEALR